jgi:hypothetical protein
LSSGCPVCRRKHQSRVLRARRRRRWSSPRRHLWAISRLAEIENEFKAAATLLAREIKESKEISTDVLKKGRWPTGRSPIWTQSWGDYRASIVNHIKPEEYDAIAAAYAHLDELQHSITSGADDRPLKEPGDRRFLLRGTQAPPDDESASVIAVPGAAAEPLVTDRAIAVLKARIR